MDDDLQAKLSAIMSGQADPETALRLRQSLVERLQSTPQKPVHMMLRRMLEAKANARNPAAVDKGSELAELRKLLRAASRELKGLHERQRQLALALGACGDCWGRDYECGQCGGAGVPGWAEPDPVLFNRYVAPVLDRTDGRRRS